MLRHSSATYWAAMLQRENRQLIEKMEVLDREYSSMKNASEFIMSIIESMDTEDLKKKLS